MAEEGTDPTSGLLEGGPPPRRQSKILVPGPKSMFLKILVPQNPEWDQNRLPNVEIYSFDVRKRLFYVSVGPILPANTATWHFFKTFRITEGNTSCGTNILCGTNIGPRTAAA